MNPKFDPLFEWAGKQPISPLPPIKKTGDQLRDEGIAKVTANNEDWMSKFFAAAEKVLAKDGEVTSESIVAVCGYPDGHSSAIGAAMRALARKLKLSKTGYINATSPKSHSAVIAVWKPTTP